MENVTTLKIELGIDAQRIASQIMVNNRNIEQNISAGIQKAIDSISEQSNFEEHICTATKSAIEKCITDVLFGFNFQQKLKAVIEQKVSDVTGKYGEEIATKVFESLTNK